jgi:hypothetical protein
MNFVENLFQVKALGVANKTMANKYTDFDNKVEPVFPSAEQKKGVDMIGETLIFKDFKEMTGDNGEYLVVLCEQNEKDVSFACGSAVVVKQLKKAKDEKKLPLRALFSRVKNKEKTFSYFTLLPPEKE